MNIFLSRPTWIPAEFNEGLDNFLRLLSNLQLIPRTLGTTDYPSRAPLDEVIQIMGECSGAIILGYPQITIATGIIKDKPISKPITLATEWNHLEAGLAYAKNLPLLIVHHHNISRGIFDRGVMNAYIHQIDMTNANWAMEKSINGALVSWKNKCTTKPAFEKKNSDLHAPTKPTCPNCTDTNKNIFMRPIPKIFARLSDTNWECPICHYEE